MVCREIDMMLESAGLEVSLHRQFYAPNGNTQECYYEDPA